MGKKSLIGFSGHRPFSSDTTLKQTKGNERTSLAFKLVIEDEHKPKRQNNAHWSFVLIAFPKERNFFSKQSHLRFFSLFTSTLFELTSENWFQMKRKTKRIYCNIKHDGKERTIYKIHRAHLFFHISDIIFRKCLVL